MEQVKIVGIKEIKEGGYGLLLEEVEGQRRAALIVGPAEASSIMLKLHQKEDIAKLTHQLMVEFAQGFDIRLKQVVIFEPTKYNYQARLTWSNGNKEFEQISRASDGMALALWSELPIYMEEQVLEHWNNSNSGNEQSEDVFNNKTDVELETLLQQAIEEENYEFAAKLRDTLKERGTSR